MSNSYPSISDYIETFQHLSFVVSDPSIKVADIDKNAMDIPILLSGNFAVIAGATLPSGKRYALRCFYKNVPDIENKYKLISKCIADFQRQTPNYFVNFEYQSNGIKVKNDQYPLIKMDWVEGQTLGTYVEKNFNNPNKLQYLLCEFNNLYKFLKKNKIAHGDIQNGNVIITDLGIKLVDYDGMFVHNMKKGNGSEIGHPHFQHPERTEKHLGPDMDEFSFMVIHLSLLALIKDSHFGSYFNQENIIFTKTDFLDPHTSQIFNHIQSIQDLELYANRLSNICLAPYDNIPSFQDYLQGNNIPKATNKPVKQNTFIAQQQIQKTSPQPPPQSKQPLKPQQQTRNLSSNYPFRSSTSISNKTDSGIILAFFSFITKIIILFILFIGILIVLHLLNTSINKIESDPNSNTNSTFDIIDSIKAPDVVKNNMATSHIGNKNDQNLYTYSAIISNVSDFMNLRSTPAIRMDNVIDKIYSGDTVYIVKLEPNGWYKVIANNNEGYIYAGLLDKNTYPDAPPIAKIIKEGIKAFDLSGKHYDILKRLVIKYKDTSNYYVITEKGNLIQINKKYVKVINPNNSEIPTIDTNTLSNVGYIAGLLPETTTKNTFKQDLNHKNNYNKQENQKENSKEISHVDSKRQYHSSKPSYNPQVLHNYYQQLSNAIYAHWQQPYVKGHKKAVVEFRITHNGYFSDIKIKQSSGIKYVDDSIIKAVNDTQPFNPPPKEYNGDYVNLPVNITGY